MTVTRRVICALALLCSTPAMAIQNCPAGLPRVAPDSRFSISEPVSGEVVVTDLMTGLVWKQCGEPTSAPTCVGLDSYTWAQALLRARASTHAGFEDWRIPTTEELRSVVETGCMGPAMNLTVFPNASNGDTWTSSTLPWSTGQAFLVRMSDGTVLAGGKQVRQRVRLVRGGRGLDTFDTAALLRDGFE